MLEIRIMLVLNLALELATMAKLFAD